MDSLGEIDGRFAPVSTGEQVLCPECQSKVWMPVIKRLQAPLVRDLVHDNSSAGMSRFVCPWRAGDQSKRSRVKKWEAIVQPFKLDDVKEALVAIGVDGMT